MDGGPSCGHATAVPTTARMVREGAHGALGKTSGEPAVRGGGLSCPLRRGKTLSPTSPPASRCSPSTSKKDQEPPRAPAGAPQDSVPSTQHQERRPTRGPYQDVGSGELLAYPLSHLLPGRQVTRGPFLPLSLDVYSDKIKHLLEPPPEHGRIQFHRLDIKNDYRLEGHQDVGSGKHTANIFYYLLVVETISMHSLWESSQVINDLALG
ncbi:UDP-D-apiose/UDP-D-xylose synthase 2 [Ananas comosus]|uniref:UDP-D-apiose/UDP-D-xylose synthase 2 n=1 Tax=Ananas comosus TaxID=4615 RepID=A0A199UX47_ANACO|nr:UDP-D-apiose/UDP-D-xylose synthase 2 [Ananas comosus]